MATIPTDIQEAITKLAEVTKTPVQSLINRLKDILKTDENIQTMEKDDFKIRYAWALLYRENAVGGKTTDCIIMPLCQPQAREIVIKGEKTFVGDMAALIKKINKTEAGQTVDENVLYAFGTFWRDGAKNIQKLESGKVYRAPLIVKENKWGMGISSDRAAFLPTNETMPSLRSFFEQQIKPKNLRIGIGEMDLNKCDYPTDIRVLEATVIESEIGDKEGRSYGRYTIMDDSVIGGNFTIFVDPKDVVWSQGSIVDFGGTIDIDDKSGQIRWKNHFILPTDMAMKKEIHIKPVKGQQESVDISMPEKVPIIEVKKNVVNFEV